MNDVKSDFRLHEITMGLFLMVCAISAVYTAFAYGAAGFFPYILVVFPLVSFYSVFLFLPMVALLVRLKKTGLLVLVLSCFILAFVVLSIINIGLFGLSNIFIENGRSLVVDGIITKQGYIKAVKDSVVTALIVSIGAILFWLVSLRKV